MTNYLVRAKGGKPIGPLPASLILRGIELRRVPFDAEVREEGAAEWVPLASVDEFYEAMGLDDAQTGQSEKPQFDSVGETEGDEATRILSSLWHDESPDAVGPRRTPPPRPAPSRAVVAPLPANSSPSGARLPPVPRPPDGDGAPQPHASALPVSRPPASPPSVDRPATSSPAGPAGPLAAPARSVSAAPQAARLTPEAAQLMDADEDDDDREIVGSFSGTEAPRGSSPAFPVSPTAGEPAHSSTRPPPNYLPDRADELTAPARRLIRQQEIIRRTLAYVTAALVVAVLVLVAVVLLR